MKPMLSTLRLPAAEHAEDPLGAHARVPEPALSDASLVLRARDGDRWAHEALFRRHVDHVHRLAMRLLGGTHDAEDVVQETFAFMLVDLGRLRDPEAFRSWLIRIAVNQARKLLRRRRLRCVLGIEVGGVEPCFESLASNRPQPDTIEDFRRLEALVATLPIAQRIAWVLRHVQGETLESVAACCGCSVSTAKRRLRSAERIIGVRFTGGQP